MSRKIGGDQPEQSVEIEQHSEDEREERFDARGNDEEQEWPDDSEEEAAAGQQEPEKNKKKNVITWIVIVVAAVVLVISLVNIIGIGGENLANDKSYQELKNLAIASDDSGQNNLPAEENPLDRKIDFEALQAVNKEIIGWIYMPNTKIDYPLVHGTDNDYYISHSANKETNRAGAIFLDYQNDSGFSDQNTVIYGHRMNDGSMFADLHLYEKDAFFKENDRVYVYLPDGTVSTYGIFSSYIVNEIDDTYTLGFSSDDKFDDYLKKMQGRSGVKTDVQLSPQDKIITLSTCVQGQDTKRYVVQAVLEQ